jgi:hypothetical protein
LVSAGGLGTFTVSVASGETFNLNTVNLQASNNTHEVNLEIQGGGKLIAGIFALSNGAKNEDHITVDNTGVLNIVTKVSSDFQDTISIQGTGNGVDGGGRLQLGSASSSGIGVGNDPNITFDFIDNLPGQPSDGVVEYLSGFVSGLTTTQQQFTDVSWGDGFIFDGANFTGDTLSYSGTTITVTNSGGTVLTMDNVAAAAGTTFIASGNEILAVCYVAGTRIATPNGEVAVEALREGDLVTTLAGEAKRIRWIGRGDAHLTEANRCDLAPVIVRQDALGPGMPRRDLHLTRKHAVLVEDALVPVELLVNDHSYRLGLRHDPSALLPRGT